MNIVLLDGGTGREFARIGASAQVHVEAHANALPTRGPRAVAKARLEEIRADRTPPPH
jgi:hypothetical protein